VVLPYSTLGSRAPTALAIAAAGRLPRLAEAMGRKADTLFKWAEGERGPEHDAGELFSGMRRIGIPRIDAALLPARIQTSFEASYADELPPLHELHQPETLADTAEDRTQMCLVQDESIENQQRHLVNVLAEIARLTTVAARIERNLQLAGRT
jgi:hypothetical protein